MAFENKLLNDLASRGCAVAEMLSDTYMGNEGFYVRVLSRFPQNDAVARLRASFEAGDASGAFNASHEFKGLCGTLGLTPLYDVTCKIVELVRPQKSVAGVGELLPQLETMREEFVGVIAGAQG